MAKKNLKDKLAQHNKEVQSNNELSERLDSDIPETEAEAENGLNTASAEAADTLESTGDTTQWQRQNSAESVTDAAVEETKDEEAIKRDMLEKAAAAPESAKLASDIPETEKEAAEGAAADNIEADQTIEATVDVTEWQDEGAEEAETDAAVEAKAEKPKRHVKDDLPDYLL